MIQRKQTLFLLAAAVLCVLSFFFPIAQFEPVNPPPSYELRTTGIVDVAAGVPVVDAAPKYPIHILYVVLALAAIVVIFLYKNRRRQLAILRSLYVFCAILVVLQLITYQSAHAYLGQGRALNATYGPTLFLPVIILAALYMAQRGISGDEQLVKSMDRIR
jgi:Domain of unknown function (DUF4293)